MEKAIIEIPSNIYYTINLLWVFLTAICLLLITLCHIVTSNKYDGLNCFHKSYPKSLSVSFLLILFGYLCCIALCLEFFEEYDIFSSIGYCWFIKYIGPFTYISFKCISYTILILRLYEAYNNTPIGYKPNRLIIWETIILIWAIIGLLMTTFTGGVQFDINGSPKCKIIWFIPAVGFNVLFDITVGIINTYLFITPICRLQSVIKSDNHKNTDSDLTKLTIKQSILSSIVIGSSLLVLIGAVLIGMVQVLTGTDIILSISSIICMFSWNDVITDKIFKCCYKKKLLTKTNKNIKNLEISVGEGTNTTATNTETVKDTITTTNNMQIIINGDLPTLQNDKSLSVSLLDGKPKLSAQNIDFVQ